MNPQTFSLSGNPSMLIGVEITTISVTDDSKGFLDKRIVLQLWRTMFLT